MSNKLVDYTVFVACGEFLDSLVQFVVHCKAGTARFAYSDACELLQKDPQFKLQNVVTHVVFEGFHKPREAPAIKFVPFKEKVKKEFFISNKKR
jgi:hypothetical protein